MSEPKDQWIRVNGAVLMESLEKIADGGDPDLEYIELYANSEESKE